MQQELCWQNELQITEKMYKMTWNLLVPIMNTQAKLKKNLQQTLRFLLMQTAQDAHQVRIDASVPCMCLLDLALSFSVTAMLTTVSCQRLTTKLLFTYQSTSQGYL